MQNNVLLTIREKIIALPQSEKKIAETILKDPVSVIKMSATDLAAEAGSSSAAVIRFCRSIGVKGFTELKLQLSADSQGIKDNLYTDIQSDESLDQVKKKLLINTNHLFNETNNVLSTKQIERTTKLLYESSVIYLYGLGASHIVASDIQQKFSRMGKIIICSLDQHFLVTSMAVASEGAVFFGVSNSGEKKEVLALMTIAKELGLKTVSLTSNTENTLSLEADIALKTAFAHEAPLRSGATISLLTQMYAVDILFYDYASKYYELSVTNLEKSKAAIQRYNQNFDTKM
ncbi:MurR/RpiR family transcriptional regulator [Carnobacterium sp. ISL-102]|uniref:MurR/RpiR family transcriptional regulator n=1 Tax=Carnobacterium sp. ISL-102 TaxID=2819142 RepID=UPI001BE663C7|nr:MurR/RpiR family transcriptional regulator [Carnobacterium sp. ISL-102]MBT2731013.1 MurR/RpiR family transcriptional regulator [Carnobacterium sp. ISL-102]